MKVTRVLSLVALSALVGCATSAPLLGPSNVASDTPPQIVTQMIDGNAVNVWDDVSKFGPVPDSLMATAEEICKSVGATGPWGYHPEAKDVKGNPFDGGGYLCRFD